MRAPAGKGRLAGDQRPELQQKAKERDRQMDDPGAGVHGLAQLAHQADVAHLFESSDVVAAAELGLLVDMP